MGFLDKYVYLLVIDRVDQQLDLDVGDDINLIDNIPL